MHKVWRWRHTSLYYKEFKLPPGTVCCWWNSRCIEERWPWFVTPKVRITVFLAVWAIEKMVKPLVIWKVEDREIEKKYGLLVVYQKPKLALINVF